MRNRKGKVSEMKKVIAICLCVLTVVAICACGGSSVLAGTEWKLTKATYQGQTIDVSEMDMEGTLSFSGSKASVDMNGEKGTGRYTVSGDVESGSYTVTIKDPDGEVVATVEGDTLTISQSGVDLIFEKQ